MAYMRLGDLLIAAGAITQEQLEEALTIQKQKKERLGDVLIESNIITERQLIEALQMQLGVDFIDLTAISIPLELAKFVPRAIAKKYNVVPVKLVKDELFVAMSDPLNFVAQEEIKAASHKRVVPMISTRRATEQAIGTLYGSEGTARAIEEMKREVGTSTPDIVPVQMNQTDAGNASAAPTIRFVNSVIERAFLERASDIHLEPQEGEMVVRMRIDGILRKILTVPANLQSNVISRLKIMGGMNISERKIPQDGRAMVQVRHHEIDLRISSMPTIYGEKIVLRLLDKSGHTITKQSIGLEGTDLQKYDALLKNSSGVILIVGPTGSGKSTTMCAMLQELANEETNLMTLEDPVEYNIPGVNQCQINEKTGMTFAAGLRAILRQDPDVISVGEIRDGETGAIAIRAAITGHLVLSTLHTNDAVSAIDRLVDIGVSRTSFPARCAASSPNALCARSARTARRRIGRRQRSLPCSACRRTPTCSSTAARAVRSATTPATRVAVPSLKSSCSTGAFAAWLQKAQSTMRFQRQQRRRTLSRCAKTAVTLFCAARSAQRKPRAPSIPQRIDILLKIR